MSGVPRRRVAVVLFNLGGPDSQESVRPFLFNLFNDPAIINLPNPLRWGLAQLISSRRAPIAQEIYAELGGGSPLLPNTKAQAQALEISLSELGTVRVFIAMRYWHPFSDRTAAEVAEFQPDDIVLLPLYPQFSTTTTGSSLKDWARAARSAGVSGRSVAVCCYPMERGFVAAVRKRIEATVGGIDSGIEYRILFSAHGLPKKIVDRGDPYQWQVEQSAEAIVEVLGCRDLDWVVCYQSRVGPLEWIGPSTDSEIERAGRDNVAVVLVPIAFVSEHSETLVELDIEYRKLATEHGVPSYHRVPTVGIESDFISGLAELVGNALEGGSGLSSMSGARLCPECWKGCPVQAS